MYRCGWKLGAVLAVGGALALPGLAQERGQRPVRETHTVGRITAITATGFEMSGIGPFEKDGTGQFKINVSPSTRFTEVRRVVRADLKPGRVVTIGYRRSEDGKSLAQSVVQVSEYEAQRLLDLAKNPTVDLSPRPGRSMVGKLVKTDPLTVEPLAGPQAGQPVEVATAESMGFAVVAEITFKELKVGEAVNVGREGRAAEGEAAIPATSVRKSAVVRLPR